MLGPLALEAFPDPRFDLGAGLGELDRFDQKCDELVERGGRGC